MATYPVLSPAYTSAQLTEAGNYWLNDYLGGSTITSPTVPLDVVPITHVDVVPVTAAHVDVVAPDVT